MSGRIMLVAIFTTFLFAASAVTGQRVAYRLGGIWGNFVWLSMAVAILGLLVVFFAPGSLQFDSLKWFFLSGVIGFGIGDVALFLAYERIGSRLTILLNLCLAPLFAMSQEWLWLGNAVSPAVLGCAAIILFGVILALRPGASTRQSLDRRGSFGLGVGMAILAGWGQGTGAVISRHAEEIAAELGVVVTGFSAAFQRVVGGWLFVMLLLLAIRLIRGTAVRQQWGNPFSADVAPWLFAAVLCGPVIGVTCFQMALQNLESGIVLAVVATTPIVLMPMAALTEGDRPTALAIIGALVAVAGVSLLYLAY